MTLSKTHAATQNVGVAGAETADHWVRAKVRTGGLVPCAVLFIEDLEGIEVWFIARDEDGKPQGLAIDEVEEATLPLHNLVEAQQYAAGASPSEPLKAVLFDRLRTTPTFKRSLLVGGTGK